MRHKDCQQFIFQYGVHRIGEFFLLIHKLVQNRANGGHRKYGQA
jgi:hypothetical protein